MELRFNWVVPILRIFDIAKAEEFYQQFLGFSVDWDHRFDAGAPLYRQISRGSLILHLSEHHGDGSPGARIRVMMQGVEEFHREISSKGYRYMRPGLEPTPWGTIETGVIDPFGNLIRFCEPKREAGAVSILHIGLPLDHPSIPVEERVTIANRLSELQERMTRAGYQYEITHASPNTGLDGFRGQLRSRPPDGVLIGGAVAGDPAMSYFMEQIIDAAHAVVPKAKIMIFNHSEDVPVIIERWFKSSD